jgi:hypothetical protein
MVVEGSLSEKTTFNIGSPAGDPTVLELYVIPAIDYKEKIQTEKAGTQIVLKDSKVKKHHRNLACF